MRDRIANDGCSYTREHAGALDHRFHFASSLVDANFVAQRSGEIRCAIARLAGKLNVHLSLEDKSLYPYLENSTDDKVRATARHFACEMGSISDAFAKYINCYPTARAIEADPEQFIADTKSIFGALDNRIRRENEELYPLADAA